VDIIWQIALPVAVGLAVVATRLVFKRSLTPLDSLGFLVTQLVLIYWFGYGTLPGIALVVAILAAIAIGAKYQAAGRAAGKPILLACVLIYLLYWIITKYVPANAIAALLNISPESGDVAPALRLMTIVGISYIGFKLMHFYVDFRSGEIAQLSVLEFLNWLLFFPSIVAGPMQRYQAWQEQRLNAHVTADDAATGVKRIVVGLFMKVVLADTLRGLTLPAFTDIALQEAPFHALAGASILYTIYLYLDFAGYSHIAIGTGMFWGIKLPENFNHPFISRNLSEFWNRWHMSLSSIFREYLFYPLSIAIKRSKAMRSLPLVPAVAPPLLTFLVVGIWHGAGISFIVLGILHGLGLGFLAAMRGVSYRPWIRVWWSRSLIGHATGVVITFLYVSLTFVFFGLPWERVEILVGRIF
jgi:D-alanyl-lipoteichoic acid acyltransferase DltB (MBOAT superfamily)